jgi:hypothetical protein
MILKAVRFERAAEWSEVVEERDGEAECSKREKSAWLYWWFLSRTVNELLCDFLFFAESF